MRFGRVPWLRLAFVLSVLTPWAVIARERVSEAERVAPAHVATAAARPVAEAPPSTADASTVGAHDRLAPPWGHLERQRVDLEPPIGDLSSDLCFVTPTFHVRGPEAVDRVVRMASLEGADRRALAEAVRCDAGGCDVAPPLPLLSRIGASQRAGLYEDVLASPVDASFPIFRRLAVDTELWTRGAGLAPETKSALADLSFRRGDLVFFADLALLCSRISDRAERARLVAALGRTASLVVRLKVGPDSDLDALGRYWGVGGREPEVRPLLEAASRVPGGGSIDVTHLLPIVPRERLYSYPRPGEANLDCHHASMNFDAATKADARFTDERAVMAEVSRTMREVPVESATFGDRLIWTTQDGTVVHSAVHIADDVVYTKNGHGLLRPWVLASRGEVAAIYFRAMRVRAFRRR
jgi:hypothetical protein